MEPSETLAQHIKDLRHKLMDRICDAAIDACVKGNNANLLELTKRLIMAHHYINDAIEHCVQNNDSYLCAVGLAISEKLINPLVIILRSMPEMVKDNQLLKGCNDPLEYVVKKIIDEEKGEGNKDNG